MSEQNEVRWFCEQCLEDQTTNIWDHYDRTIGRALCPSCKAKGGIDLNDNRSHTSGDVNSNELPSDTEPNESDVLG